MRTESYPPLNQGFGAKAGLVLGTEAVTVDHDGHVDVRWSEAVSDDFAKNQVRCLWSDVANCRQ